MFLQEIVEARDIAGDADLHGGSAGGEAEIEIAPGLIAADEAGQGSIRCLAQRKGKSPDVSQRLGEQIGRAHV